MAFAIYINYFSNDSIGFIIRKALTHEKALEKLMETNPETTEEKKDRKPEEDNENVQTPEKNSEEENK